MNGWFLTFIIFYVLNLGVSLAKHGEKRTGEISFWTALVGTLIGVSILYMAVKTGF